MTFFIRFVPPCIWPQGALTDYPLPLYFAQHRSFTRLIMKKSVTKGPPRELRPIDPNLSVPSQEQSDAEAHSMLQVIEALERDKTSDQNALAEYTSYFSGT